MARDVLKKMPEILSRGKLFLLTTTNLPFKINVAERNDPKQYCLGPDWTRKKVGFQRLYV